MAAAPAATSGLTGTVSPPDPLQRFCADLQAAVPPCVGETAVPFRGLREALVRVLGEGARAVAADLRKEMAEWGAAVKHLERLSASPYLPDPEAVQALRVHLERACKQAARIAEALEAAPCTGGGPAVRVPPARRSTQVEPRPAVSEGGRADPPKITAAPTPALPNHRKTAEQPRQLSRTQDEARTPPAVAVPAEGRGHSRDAPVPAVPSKPRRWMEKTAHDAADRGRSLRRWGRRTVPFAALVLVLAAFFLLGQRTPSAPPEELPRELKPRVELFVQAWLGRDIPRMKQLTAATRERAVYSWFKKNQPPRMPDGSEDGGKYGAMDIEVKNVPGGDKMARVEVQVREVTGASGKTDVRLTLLWEERGEAWYFVPPLR
ncbi:MAG: hypothetical protein HYS12_16445 [Planctomycetes bacterium]|nr:hypothetical protein [Planctomycetota bacterium]